MPLIIGLLIVLAAMYQFIFRYDRWESDKKAGVFYEYDRLTGETRTVASEDAQPRRIEIDENDADNMKPHPDERSKPLEGWVSQQQSSGERESGGPPVPGEKASVADASEPQEAALALPALSPLGSRPRDHRQVARIAKTAPVPQDVVIASSAPPVPQSILLSDNVSSRGDSTPFAIRQVDIDQDGVTEEIIQNAAQPDGLLDISIVKNGREVFFGRGKEIALLPSRNRGWADIALKMGPNTLQVFRYDLRDATYRMLDPNHKS